MALSHFSDPQYTVKMYHFSLQLCLQSLLSLTSHWLLLLFKCKLIHFAASAVWLCPTSVVLSAFRWVWLGVAALGVGAVQTQRGDVILLQRGVSPRARPWTLQGCCAGQRMRDSGGSAGLSPWSVNCDVLLAEESYFCLKSLLSGTAAPANVFAVFFCQIQEWAQRKSIFIAKHHMLHSFTLCPSIALASDGGKSLWLSRLAN